MFYSVERTPIGFFRVEIATHVGYTKECIEILYISLPWLTLVFDNLIRSSTHIKIIIIFSHVSTKTLFTSKD